MFLLNRAQLMAGKQNYFRNIDSSFNWMQNKRVETIGIGRYGRRVISFVATYSIRIIVIVLHPWSQLKIWNGSSLSPLLRTAARCECHTFHFCSIFAQLNIIGKCNTHVSRTYKRVLLGRRSAESNSFQQLVSEKRMNIRLDVIVLLASWDIQHQFILKSFILYARIIEHCRWEWTKMGVALFYCETLIECSVISGPVINLTWWW